MVGQQRPQEVLEVVATFLTVLTHLPQELVDTDNKVTTSVVQELPLEASEVVELMGSPLHMVEQVEEAVTQVAVELMPHLVETVLEAAVAHT